MNTIKIWGDTASPRQLQDIADRLHEGEIAVIPTDTLYAVVGDALNVKAVERICKIKGINPDKSNLSIICSSISMASEYSRIDNTAYRLMKENCPGPYTFLLRAASTLPRAFKGRKTVGVRIPSLQFDRDLAETLGNPLITTSIEFDDPDYAKSPGLIAEAYDGRVEIMVEGEDGSTDLSTVVDCTADSPEVVREGIGVLR